MDKKSKIIIIIIASVVAVLAAISISFAVRFADQFNKGVNQSQETNNQQISRKVYVSYKGQEGKTALDILKSLEKVETKSYEGLGEMVVSIDGTAAKDSSEFWAFYVEGKQAQVGADQYVTKKGEKIEWKLEKIQ